MFCQFCGAQNADTDKFCTTCGNQLIAPSVAVEPTPVAPFVEPIAAAPVVPVVEPIAAAPVVPVVEPIAAAPVAPVVEPIAAAPVAPVVEPIAAAPVAPVVEPIAAAPVTPVPIYSDSSTFSVASGGAYQYVVLQVTLKEKFFGTGSGNLTQLESAINAQAALGYRLHTISTTTSHSTGLGGGDRIQATMVFEKIN